MYLVTHNLLHLVAMTSIFTAMCVFCEVCAVGEEMVFIIETPCVPCVLWAQIDRTVEC